MAFKQEQLKYMEEWLEEHTEKYGYEYLKELKRTGCGFYYDQVKQIFDYYTLEYVLDEMEKG